MKIIETEFGCPIDSIYSYISNEPIAAASFSQVYRGCTVDGTVVAIKVQRPNLLHSVVRDIYILGLGLALLRKAAKRKSDLSLYADELGKGFVGELDYTIEAANATKFLETHSRYSFMLVPKVFRQFTRKRVLTMEWVIGRSPSELLLLSRGLGNGHTQYSERQKLEANACLIDLDWEPLSSQQRQAKSAVEVFRIVEEFFSSNLPMDIIHLRSLLVGIVQSLEAYLLHIINQQDQY